MSSKVEKLETNKVKIEITVSAEDFAKGVDEAFKKNAPKFSVPGFRKGKVPRNIIEKYYGQEVVYEDAFNIVAPKAYDEAIKENSLEPVCNPEIDITKIEKGSEMIFTAEVYLKPEVELGKYKGLKIEKNVYTVENKEIEEELQSMRDKNARILTIEDRALKDGDISNIDFEGFCDGEAFEGGKAEDFELTIGSGQFIPGFEEQLIGMNLNETKEINVKFPEEYNSKDLAGKDAMFRVTLNGIKAKELPELDDEFAKDVSEFDTLTELRADLEKHKIELNEKKEKAEVEDLLFKEAYKEAKMDIPKPMIDEEIESILKEYNYRLQMQGMSLEMYLKMMNQDLDTFKAGLTDNATERIKIRLTIEKISEVEEIKVTDEEIEEKVAEMAKQYGKDIESMKKTLTEEHRKYLSEDIKVEKVLKVLVENAKITEKKSKEEE